LDIVPSLIERNRRQHPQWRFEVADATRDPLPRADLVLCRDLLVHLSFADARAVLRNVRRSGASYLLTTTFPSRTENAEILSGEWRPLNLELPPFSLPPPLQMITEGSDEADGAFADKSLALWRVEDVPA
jgi:hypothetical protein